MRKSTQKTTAISHELQLFRSESDCAAWFTYPHEVDSVLQRYFEFPSFEPAIEQLNGWLANYLFEPKSLYIQINAFIELSEKSPKTFFQLLGIGLTPQQTLSGALKSLHKRYVIEQAGNHELEIKKDILSGNESYLLSIFPDFENKIKLLQLEKSKLETEEKQRYQITINLLTQQLESAQTSLEERDLNIQKLEASLRELEASLSERDAEIAALRTKCDGFKATLARIQVENAQRFQQQQSDIEFLKAEVQYLKENQASSLPNPPVEEVSTTAVSSGETLLPDNTPTEATPPEKKQDFDIFRQIKALIFNAEKEPTAAQAPNAMQHNR